MCCWCSPCRGSSRSSERGSGVELAGQSGRSLRRARKFGYELRTSATKLRYANPYGIDFACGSSAAERRGLHERTYGTRIAALRPRAAAGCRSLRDRARRKALRNEQQQRAAASCGGSIRNRKFKIQYSGFTNSGRSLRRTRTSGLADAKCGLSRGEATAR